MWRPTYTILRKACYPALKENLTLSRSFFTSKSRQPRSTVKLTLVSASIGVLVGVGYGGYTHYKVNSKKKQHPMENDEYALLKEPPVYTPHYKIVNDRDTSDLQLVLFQYRTCPFCCKVRAYLDSKGISYEIVEVDAVLRQAIKWSGYKKVPIVLVKTDAGYQQLLDSTAIISVLETYLLDKSYPITDIIKFYPANKFLNDTGNKTTEIANRYFVMSHTPLTDGKVKDEEMEERKWRQWADKVLVHTLSPNVYRTAGEALETFRWFEAAGGWRDAFPFWECALMVYGGAAAMWLISKRLKKRHHIKENARESLYDAARDWTAAVKKKGTPFLGGQQPNLADITVYGVLSSIEGCKAFVDLRTNTDIGIWYDNVKNVIESKMGKVIATALQRKPTENEHLLHAILSAYFARIAFKTKFVQSLKSATRFVA